MEIINVGIIEDDKTIHESLMKSVELYPAFKLSFDAYSVEEALKIMETPNFITPDVILLDIGLPGMNGIQGIPHIKKAIDETNIIMLTSYEENELIFSALCAGACSYISKKTSLKVIMDSIFTVYRGGSYMSPSIARKIANHFKPVQSLETVNKLTDRQLQIVEGLSQGLSYKMIAKKLTISIDTVRTHIKKIYKTLEVNSKIEVLNLYKDGRI